MGSYRLTILQGPAPGKVFELTKDILTLGRDVRNDLVVNDAEVSRSHARLTRQDDGYLVEDLASTNGTFVNGQRLTSPKLLQPDDMLGLGETVVLELKFVPDLQATVIAPDIGAGAPAAPPPAPAAPRAPGTLAPDYTPRPAEPAPAPEARGGSAWRWIAISCGCLTVLVCLAGVAGLGMFLWNAPLEFWQSLGIG